MKKKLTKFKIFRFLCLLAYIVCAGVLIFESSMDGTSSAAQSNAVGGAIKDVVNNVAGDDTKMVVPTNLTIDNKVEEGYVGDNFKLEVTTLPENASYKATDFKSSNEEIATISYDGTISFLKAGSVTFTATNHDYRDVKDFFTVEVLNVDVSEVKSTINASLNDDVYALHLENNYKVSSVITPSNATFKDLSYTIDNESYIKIDENGNITPIAYSKNEITTITITCGEITDTLKVIVDYENVVKLTDFDIGNTEYEIFKTQSINLSVLPIPSDTTFADYTLESNDSSIVSISSKNSFKGVSIGQATLTLSSTTYENISKTITVIVKEQPAITDFSVPETMQIVEGNTKNIKASNIKPSYAIGTYTYSSDNEEYVTVNSKGKVKAIKPTSSPVIITVTCNGVSKQIAVTVKEYVPPIIVDEKDYTTKDFTISNLKGELPIIYFNDSIDLSEYFVIDKFINNEDNEYTPKDENFTYSVDALYGSISNTTFTSNTNGEVIITLTHTASGKENTVSLYVLDEFDVAFDINSDLLIDNTYNLKASDSFTFEIESEAFNRDNIIQRFEVSSSSDIAAINQNEDGTYSVNVANKNGEFNIIVECFVNETIIDSLTKTYSFKVLDNLINEIDISLYNEDNEKISLRIDDTTNHYIFAMNVDDICYVSNSFLPSSPSSYQLEYSTSNNKIAYVDSLGLLVVKGIGEVTITITDKKTNLEKSIDIVISNKILLDEETPVSFKGFEANYDSENKVYSLTNGYSGSISLNFLKETTYSKVSFKSSDENIIKVSKNGTLTPLSQGEAKITMTIDDGMQEPIIVEVKVRVNPQPVIKDVKDFFYKVRKGLGHFGAFLVLGICSTFTYLLYFKKKKWIFSIPLNIYMGFTLAAFTEYIQTLVVGRHGCWDDIWIDFVGFMFSAVILSILIPLVYLIKYLINKRKLSKGEK